MTRRKGIDASELMRQLNADPAYLARMRAYDEAVAPMLAELAEAERPLVGQLNEAGLTWVRSIWDLVNTSEPYPRVLPILIEHLQRDYPPKLQEGIARALAVPAARPYWTTLLRVFRSHPDGTVVNGAKWGLGCALSSAATEDVLGDVIAIVQEPRHGENRIAFLSTLDRSKSPEALAALEAAAQDPELKKEADFLLRKRRRRSRKR